LDAHKQRQQFRGNSPAEMAAWLRQMLACNLTDALRTLQRDKRDVKRERSLDAAIEQSSSRLQNWLAAEQATPSQQAMHSERLLRLADALTALPDAQRDALVFHYLQGLSLAKTAGQLNRS